MLKKFIISLALVSFEITVAYAEPAINSLSVSSVSHKSTITIEGSDFGPKNPASPVWWDDCEDATEDSPAYLEGIYYRVFPQENGLTDTYWLTQYRAAGFRNVAAAHSKSTKYIAGGHKQEEDHSGRNVAFIVDLSPGSGTEYEQMFLHFRYRHDPLWPPYGGSCPNLKYIRYGNNPNALVDDPHQYEQSSGYGGFCVKYGDSGSDWGCHDLHTEIDGWDTCKGDSTYGPSNLPCRFRNPKYDWIQIFEVVDIANGTYEIYSPHSDGVHYAGWIHNARTPMYSWNIEGVQMGGFYRKNGCDSNYVTDDNAFRYFDDIYIDNTLSRVYLGDNQTLEHCTKLEIQIPSSWSASSITITVNTGSLPKCETAYLFVFDADNNYNIEGYPVSVAPASGEPPCPPERLRVVR